MLFVSSSGTSAKPTTDLVSLSHCCVTVVAVTVIEYQLVPYPLKKTKKK